MAVSISDVDTITSLSANNILTSNGNKIEEISQANFLAALNIPSYSGANVTSVSTSGTSLTPLHALTIPANTLAALNDAINWVGSFTSTGGVVAGTNTASLYIDGVNVCSLAMSSLTNSITVTGKFQLTILWSNTNELTYIADYAGTRAAGTIYTNFATGAQAVTTASPFDIEIRGQCAQSDADITCVCSILM